MSRQTSGRRKPLSNRTLYEPDGPEKAAPTSSTTTSSSGSSSKSAAEPVARSTSSFSSTAPSNSSAPVAGSSSTSSSTQETGLKCFRCRQRGHTRAECPFRRGKEKKKDKILHAKGQQRSAQNRRGDKRKNDRGVGASHLVAGMPISLLKKEVAKKDAGLKHLVEDEQPRRILAQDAPHPGLGKLRKLWSPGGGSGSSSSLSSYSSSSAAAASSDSLDRGMRRREDSTRNSGVASTFAFPLVSRNWRLVAGSGGTQGFSSAAAAAASGDTPSSSVSVGSAAASVAAAAGAQSLRKDPSAFTVVGVLGRQGVGKS